MSELQDKLKSIYEETSSKLIPENIKKDVTVLGVTGTLGDDGIDTSDATATAEKVLIDEIAYTNTGKIIGTMPNNGELNYTPSTEEQTIPAGYTSGGKVTAVDITSLDDYERCESICDVIMGSSPLYTKVEYIESSGTQYIDTGLKGSNNTKITLRFCTFKLWFRCICNRS